MRFVVCCCYFFQNHLFSKNSLRNTIRVSNSSDPHQARQFVWPDLGANVCKSYQQTTLVGKEFTLTHGLVHSVFINRSVVPILGL